MNRTFIIAEAGVNHNGSLDMAKKLVLAAAEAGADAVKFQTFSAAKLVSKTAGKARYQEASTDAAESQFEMLKKLELAPEAFAELADFCARSGILFLSTPFDHESIDLLSGLGMETFKVPSGEITNLPYLRRVAKSAKWVILSTGMANLGEVEAALTALELSGLPRSAVTVLHATTEYPAPMREVNLRAMQTMGNCFGVKTGYSDHTPGIEIPIAAVAMGASVVEKHFTLDRRLSGPDHKASLEPHELKAMITAIRNVELALGDGIKAATPCELENRAVARKSIVASRTIVHGEIFSEANLAVKRPGTGISPMRWDELMGRAADRGYREDEPIRR